jgi:signal peptidase II
MVFVIALDQLTKFWATASLLPVRSVELLPGFFDLTYVRNTGIAFGMFAHQAVLVAGFVVLLGLAAFYYARGVNWARWEPNLVGGCLVGGAVGNLLDRTRLGYVVDFFDVHVGAHHWPVFNIADSFICCAVAWIVVGQLRTKG